jgi:hypothetical protein
MVPPLDRKDSMTSSVKIANKPLPHIYLPDPPAYKAPKRESNKAEETSAKDEEAVEFPTGITLALIILALCLSILVMSLGANT